MVNAEILTYIRTELGNGKDRQVITADLMANGWSKQDVDEAFNALNPNPNPTSVPASTPIQTSAPILAQTQTSTPIIQTNAAPMTSKAQPTRSMWTKIIPRTNTIFLIIYICLVFGLDLVIVRSSWDLAPFWYMMLYVFGAFMVFYLFENFILSPRLKGTTSHRDTMIGTLIILRNIVCLLNFIPFIQLLGLGLISGFIVLFALGRSFGLGLGFGSGLLPGLYGIVTLVGPALLVVYIVLVWRRLSEVKKS